MQSSRGPIPVLLDPDSVNIPTVLSVTNGIQKTAMKHGMDVRLYMDIGSLLKEEKDTKTVILSSLESPRMLSILDTLQKANKRAVLTNVDADHVDAHYSCVTFSRRLMTEQMLDYLFRKGALNIALLGCGIGSSNDEIHLHAMKDYLARHGIGGCEVFCYSNKVLESFEAFAANKDRFDTILCVNPYVAVAFLRYCETHRISIPRDYMLASLKDSCSCRLCKPSVTSIFENTSLIGEQAIVIWNYLEDYPSEDLRMRIAVMGSIIERESTRTKRQQSIPVETNTEAYHEGGPFYQDETIRNAFTLERCLVQCDELDYKIIALLLKNNTHDTITDQLFLSRSALQYRLRKLYQMTGTVGKEQFIQFFKDTFTREHHLD